MERSAARLEQIRQDLVQAGEAHWRDLIAALGAAPPDAVPATLDANAATLPSEGAVVRLDGVDPTRQSGDHETRHIVHAQGGLDWGLRLDLALIAALGRLHEHQAAFGFPRAGSWDVIGRFVGLKPGAREEDVAIEADLAVVSARALHVRGQVTLLVDGDGGVKVPGIEAAEQALAALHAPLTLPAELTPEALLTTLLATLAHHHWPLFRTLWVPGTTDLDLHFKWDQFRQAFGASGGDITLDRAESVGTDGTRLKLFVTRGDGQAHTWTRPLTLRRIDGQWHLEAGIL